MKKRLTNILTGLMMVAAMALTISACGGGDDGSSATNNNNNGGNGSPGQGSNTGYSMKFFVTSIERNAA